MPLLSESEQKRLREAVERAEGLTSGEIVVAIRESLDGDDDVDTVAKQFFVDNQLTRTRERNAVLLLIACEERKLAILGDEGINQRVPDNFWDDVVADLTTAFKKGAFIEGLEAGIEKIGCQLGSYFPRRDDDENELPDEIRLDG